jgi:hypothetical protein
MAMHVTQLQHKIAVIKTYVDVTMNDQFVVEVVVTNVHPYGVDSVGLPGPCVCFKM